MTVAWVLPGGASLGAVQAGQAQALFGAGHHPDLIVGTSAGSLNATWIAAEPSERGADELAALWLGVRRREVFPISPVRVLAGLAGRRDHVVSSRPLAAWLRSHLPLWRLQDAAIPLTVTATDLDSGEPVFLDHGDAIPALLASCAMPGVFPPVVLDGRVLVDGGMAADAPVSRVVESGADRVYILPTLGPVPPGRPRGALDVLLRSIGLILGNARDTELEGWWPRCELYVLPAPSIPGISPFSFNYSATLVSTARELTQSWLPRARPYEHRSAVVAED